MTDRKYIYEIYRQGSFSAAAKALFVSQPTLSIAVKRTEEKLGITIFDRTSPLRLTQEGKIFIQAIEQMQHIEESMQVELADMAQLKSGKLTVCCETFAASFILPRILLRFFEKYPGIDLTLLETDATHLRESLLDESADLAISHAGNNESFEYVPLFSEEVLLAVPEQLLTDRHPRQLAITAQTLRNSLSAATPVDIRCFADLPFLFLKNGNDMYRRAQAIFKTAGCRPTVKCYPNQLISSYNMACAGLGAAFVTDTVVKNSENTGCVFFRLKSDETRRCMTVVHKRKHYTSKAVNAFIETAKEAYSPEVW